MSVALICEAWRMSDRRCSSIPMLVVRSILLSFSIASLVKERFCGSGFRHPAHSLVHGRFIILQQPFVQFLLGEINHFTARFVVRYLLARCELVQHTFRNPDIHAGFLKCENSLGREDGIFQQRNTLQETFDRFQFLQYRFNGGEPSAHPLHECHSIRHNNTV